VIRHLRLVLVLVLSSDVNWCATPHPKREAVKDPNHDDQQREFFNDVDPFGFDTALIILFAGCGAHLEFPY